MEYFTVDSRCTLKVKEDSLREIKLCTHPCGYREYSSLGDILNARVSDELAGNADCISH